MVEKSYHLTDYHAQILAGLPKDTKQKIIHDHELNDLSKDTLAKLHNLPVEAVWAIINRSISSCTFLLTGRISSDSEGR